MKALLFALVILCLVCGMAGAATWPKLSLSVTGNRPPILAWNPPLVAVMADSGVTVTLTSTLTNTGSSVSGHIALDAGCDPIFSIASGGGVFTLGPNQSRVVTISATLRDRLVHTCFVSSGP